MTINTDTYLRGADLRGALLICADLSGADLSGADLRFADLSGTDLTGADLTGADLTGADLSGADLRETKFSADQVMWMTLSGQITPDQASQCKVQETQDNLRVDTAQIICYTS